MRFILLTCLAVLLLPGVADARPWYRVRRAVVAPYVVVPAAVRVESSVVAVEVAPATVEQAAPEPVPQQVYYYSSPAVAVPVRVYGSPRVRGRYTVRWR